MKMIQILIFFTLLIVSANGKIIEVEQLFNKKITTVKQEQISIKKEFYGKTKIDETKIIDIVTRFDGYITSLYANKNYMNIKKNQPLFSIYSDEILSIQKEIKVSKTLNKGLYRSSLEKLKVLDINKKEINKIKALKVTTSGINIYSPINGFIIKKTINDRSAVKKGKTLFQIANFEKLWFIAKVYQKDLNFIRKASGARVYINGVNSAIKAKLDFIYPMVDEKSKTIDVRFIIDNKDLKLYPNMFAKASIKSVQKTMLTLPKTAVLNKGSSYYVFKPISKSEFEPVLVEVKRISSNKYEILDGLSKGEKVLDNALFLLDSDALTNALYESDDDDW
jgi:Cu(I)/Ag(I) efflux system membrane fusion protein